MAGDRDPAQLAAVPVDELCIGRLGDRRDGAAVVGEISDLRAGRPGVGGHRDCTELRAGVPGEHGLQAVVEMDQDEVAGRNAARRQARREPADRLVEHPVAQRLPGALERLPDQERMVAPGARPRRHQPAQIDSGKRAHIGVVHQRTSRDAGQAE